MGLINERPVTQMCLPVEEPMVGYWALRARAATLVAPVSGAGLGGDQQMTSGRRSAACVSGNAS